VKILSSKSRSESLPVHTDTTRFRKGEAGSRAQSDSRHLGTLALTGSCWWSNI